MTKTKKSISGSTLIVVAALLGLALSGCGRSNLVYSDDRGTGGISTDGLNIFRPGFYNQSVNQAAVDIATSNSSRIVRFKSIAGSLANSSYNDSSFTGNFALLGISLFHETRLDSLTSYGFESKQMTGSRPLDLYLQVDLLCDGTTPHVLHAMGVDLPSTPALNGYVAYSINTSDSVWTSHVVAITDGANDLIPLTDSGNGLGSIDDLLTTFPDACLRNTQTYDPGFAKSLPTAGVLIGLGDASHTSDDEVYVRNVNVGTQNFTSWE
ncbi:MAG: hypothetical protein V4692_12660 [Bdellovibrionota bacterium]